MKKTTNLFRLKKENEAIEDRVIRYIRNFFLASRRRLSVRRQSVRLGNFWTNNYTEYDSNGDRNKTLSAEEYLNKIRPYLKDIINDLKKI